MQKFVWMDILDYLQNGITMKFDTVEHNLGENVDYFQLFFNSA